MYMHVYSYVHNMYTHTYVCHTTDILLTVKLGTSSGNVAISPE